MRVRHSSAPVAWSRANTPSEPASANTRSSATATPNGPMLKPLAALVQRVAPVSASTATTTPEPPWKYTVPSTTTGAVDNVAAAGCSRRERDVELLHVLARDAAPDRRPRVVVALPRHRPLGRATGWTSRPGRRPHGRRCRRADDRHQPDRSDRGPPPPGATRHSFAPLSGRYFRRRRRGGVRCS